MKFTIPDSYWNADFGYDNLVNRTIRFDGANKTIYGSDSSGYMAAIKKNVLPKVANDELLEKRTFSYFDGSKWTFDPSYGMLTPYETQHLPVFGADVLPGALNTFLFPDEYPAQGLMYPSYYELKFYNDDSKNVASKHFIAMYHGLANGVELTDFWNSALPGTLKTPLLDHGAVDFYVSLNKSFGVQTADTVKYEIANPAPQPKTWKDGLHEDSVKFYALGSKVHYYPGDYSDSAWADKFLTSPSVDGYFKNLLNFKDLKEIGNPLNYSWAYWFPDSLGALYLDSTKVRDSAEFKERVVFD
ncbi:MAG: hypothetical protein HUK21_11495, partial [Fibrobacteraceae bacterium]|nr:hypothetical protein [Fibrobacteraceae bacterium]